MMTWHSDQTPPNPAEEDPRMADGLDPQAEYRPEHRKKDDHLMQS